MKDPVGGGEMKAIAFYPAATAGPPTALGPYRVDASDGAPIAPGRFALVVLSHGHGGTRLGHHDLATALASHGFVVASLDHPLDNAQDTSGAGSDAVLLGRPLQMSALVDAVLAAPGLGEHVDPRRIGAAGFSAGGYTTLVLGGARPDFRLWQRYCRAHPTDAELCGGGRFELRVLHPKLRARADPRVRALAVMAPLALPFDRAALKGVKVPVRLYAAGKDEVLPLADNAERVRGGLPRPPEYRLFPEAGHYVFLAPCGPEQRQRVPMICEDPPGVDRGALHRELADELVAFFGRTLAP
ncbi:MULTISPECIES: dienelactone hydrolase [Myxococcaceae]|uniref:alpha/beta hydrolase family protein n=1 Tax=Myxococcaceae TaxID=31 RepID=UPI00188E7581|nr:dienelactone hydrolase [Simulacricoccus sp. 17bor-14]